MRTGRLNRLAAVLVLALGPALGAGADQADPRLPGLFRALKATTDPAEGERIGRQIVVIWTDHHNDGIDEIMREGQRFMDSGMLHLALGNFTSVTRIAPNFAEGWNKRASVLYKMGQLDAAARNVRETLMREPRHFLALAGLGAINLRRGFLEEALAVFELALEINPHLSGTRAAVEQIKARLKERQAGP